MGKFNGLADARYKLSKVSFSSFWVPRAKQVGAVDAVLQIGSFVLVRLGWKMGSLNWFHKHKLWDKNMNNTVENISKSG